MNRFVVYSGGMDSFTLLNHIHSITYRAEGTLTAISFDYGQRHRKELDFAAKVCEELKVPRIVVDLRSLTSVLSNSSLTNPDIPVPEGHYEAESMRQTVVPGRNTIMLSIAMGIAENAGGGRVYYGAHAGDHHIYPDCREGYYRSMVRMFYEATDGRVELGVPYINGNKKTILEIGKRLGLDYGKSWTCYKGGEHPCGVCGSCQERSEAFAAMGMLDPLVSVAF